MRCPKCSSNEVSAITLDPDSFSPKRVCHHCGYKILIEADGGVPFMKSYQEWVDEYDEHIAQMYVL